MIVFLIKNVILCWMSFWSSFDILWWVFSFFFPLRLKNKYKICKCKHGENGEQDMYLLTETRRPCTTSIKWKQFQLINTFAKNYHYIDEGRKYTDLYLKEKTSISFLKSGWLTWISFTQGWCVPSEIETSQMVLEQTFFVHVFSLF